MPKTLLLADDSVVIQKLVGLSFANEDVKLITTDNGNDAVSMAKERKPDIVLADVVMPGRSGYDVCQAIKSDPELAHIPVILLTGTFEAFDEARARTAGSNGHITKPFEAQALVDRVNELLRQATAAAAAAPSTEAGLEMFDSGPTSRPDAAVGRDVTRSAPPSPVAPMPAPKRPRDPLSADGGFVAPPAADRGLPALDDDDPLAAPFELDATPEPAFGEPTVAMMSESADDDWLATSPPTPASRPGAATSPPPIPRTDVTPALADVPPPLPGARAEAPKRREAPSPLEAARDESFTTIIMSDGDRSRDGLSFGDTPSSVRALDLEPADSDDDADDGSMLGDDLFGDTPRGDDSDSSFDFGADARSGGEPSRRAGDALGRPTPDPLLDSDPFIMPTVSSARERGGRPDLARQYDVSSSELIDPVEEPTAETSSLVDPPVRSLDMSSTSQEIELTDGLLGESIGLDDESDDVPGPATRPASAPSPSAPASDVSPAMRDRIHDTLERVAWEAFADLPETLIKQVVERVEAIAWEVIPQMTEALVKEEIRRMKGESEDD